MRQIFCLRFKKKTLTRLNNFRPNTRTRTRAVGFKLFPYPYSAGCESNTYRQNYPSRPPYPIHNSSCLFSISAYVKNISACILQNFNTHIPHFSISAHINHELLCGEIKKAYYFLKVDSNKHELDGTK